VGRTMVDLVFADLATTRRREVMSAVAHYIAGVGDQTTAGRLPKVGSQAAAGAPAEELSFITVFFRTFESVETSLCALFTGTERGICDWSNSSTPDH
jgi:hypothetical protein